MKKRDKPVPLPDDVYILLRDLISEYCGIYFDDSSRYIFERRLNRRLERNGFDNFRDYYRLLLYGGERDMELSEVVDALTVNETYFFREKNQLDAFAREICPEFTARKKDERKLRIWSAGCSSGEEAYTIAMLVLENAASFKGWDVEIIGSDINQRVLHTARRGVYTKNSFRAIDEYFTNKYFHEEAGVYRIRDEVKRLVDFNHLNLLDLQKAYFEGLMDVVFCRNVLIYFHKDAKRKVIESFYRRMNEGGYLLLGHAESLINVSTSFALKHLKSDMVYQKPKRPIVSMSDESLIRLVWGR